MQFYLLHVLVSNIKVAVNDELENMHISVVLHPSTVDGTDASVSVGLSPSTMLDRPLAVHLQQRNREK